VTQCRCRTRVDRTPGAPRQGELRFTCAHRVRNERAGASLEGRGAKGRLDPLGPEGKVRTTSTSAVPHHNRILMP
jgi:hypothetical protein